MSVYLDHNATTPVDQQVFNAMLPYFADVYGNPSSVHRYGRDARQAIDIAREQVAELVNVQPSQVIFTSGGTEANNLALKGYAATQKVGRMAVSEIEHASVLSPAHALQRQGWTIDTVDVDPNGVVVTEAAGKAIEDNTRLVSIMMANNETGVIQDIAALSEIARAHGSVVHTDAVQAAGKMAIDFNTCGVHMMTLSAHKLYGPKGAGALVIDKSLEIEPLLHGGGHQMGLRAGTENVAAIVGFGAAAELARNRMSSRITHMLGLRRQLENELKLLQDVVIFSENAERLPNTVFMSVPGIEGETLLMNLDRGGIAISSGSACSAKSENPSHVLLAMGVDRDLARGAIRISIGKDNTREDIEAFLSALRVQIESLKTMKYKAWA